MNPEDIKAILQVLATFCYTTFKAQKSNQTPRNKSNTAKVKMQTSLLQLYSLHYMVYNVQEIF